MTDPVRITDPVAAAHAMPIGSTVIYRHFGKCDRHEEAGRLRAVTLERRQQLLIGHDPELAIAAGADGVHFRRHSAPGLAALWRSRIPEWIITRAGLKSGAIFEQPVSALDAVFVSSIFESRSPSAGMPVGVEALTAICKKLDVPVIALGGIKPSNAGDLIGTGAAGLAGVSYI